MRTSNKILIFGLSLPPPPNYFPPSSKILLELDELLLQVQHTTNGFFLSSGLFMFRWKANKRRNHRVNNRRTRTKILRALKHAVQLNIKMPPSQWHQSTLSILRSSWKLPAFKLTCFK